MVETIHAGGMKKGKGASGYGVRSGEWKGVVPHCADTSTPPKPSAADEFMIFHLPSDPFEQNDVAATAKGKVQIKKFLALLKKNEVTCNCFQC